MGRNLADLLNKSLDAARLDLIQRVAGEASALGFPLYIVGGFVRDLLLGREGSDLDLVVEGDAIQLAGALVKKYGGKATSHSKFGTAKWNLRASELGSRDPSLPDFLDLISARSETYKHPAALPTVRMGALADDIRRRDFTVNALAVRLDGPHFGDLRDDLGGLDDLVRGLLRVLHPRSFVDDPTRMLRAVRYEQRYGFKIVNETLRLIPEARAFLAGLSPQRIRHELDLILGEPGAASMLGRLDALALLKPIHPALKWNKAAQKRLGSDASSPSFVVHNWSTINLRWLLWLMSLPEEQIKSLDERLHFTAPLRESLLASSRLFAVLTSTADWKPSQWVERLEKLPLLAVYAVQLAAPAGRSGHALEKYLTEWRYVKPKTTGHDLKRLGVAPGPKYQRILAKLRAAWLDGDVNSEQQESMLLKTFL